MNNSELNQFNLEQNQESKPEYRTIKEIVAIIKEIYEILGTELGGEFLQSSNVLLIAGLKGSNYLYSQKLLSAEISEKIDQINSRLQAYNLEIKFIRKPTDNTIKLSTFNNYIALDKITHKTKIPGVITYESKTGLRGFRDWLDKQWESFEKKYSKLIAQILVEGIALGYPDQAILDFEDSYEIANHHGKKMNESDIASVVPEKFQGAVPDFDYYPEHQDNPGIVEYIKAAKKILSEFYQNEWIQKIVNELGEK